jgi:hypothetical protein
MSFNLRLMAAASTTDYRHIHLTRRDEFSRLVSKFIAEANGTWFKDYADRIFADIRDGKRELAPLPVAKMIEHYRHCRQAVDRIDKGLHASRAEFHDLLYEDLFTGAAPSRQGTLDRLCPFLDANVVAQHRTRVQEMIFENTQETASVADFVPNLDEVIAALEAAGCLRSDSAPDERQE